MQFTFSIITCTYNAGKTLERTLGSVDAQTYPHIEHIILDGASTDGTLAIAAMSQKAKVISEPDNGLYDAMNKGLKMATGDYVIFLNAGDKFHDKDTLAKVASTLTGREDILYGETAIVGDDGEFIRMRRLKAPEILSWKNFRNGMLVCHQAFWARTEIAKRTPYDLRYKFSSDVDWCIRVMKQASVIHNTGMTLIDYLNGGMTTANRIASLRERFRIMSRHYGLAVTVARHILFALRGIIVR